MPRGARNLLTAQMVKQANRPGYFSDGGGLILQVTSTGSKSWIFRYRGPAGKIREMGLGSLGVVSLADARRQAERLRVVRSEGQDPIERKRQTRAQNKRELGGRVTFESCAEQFIVLNSPGWQNAKHAAQWRSTLKTYVYPVMGGEPVSEINTDFVTRVLEPIWSAKPETASRVRQRIERVLSWATVKELRTGANPAQWRGHLDHVFPKRSKVRDVQHHRALAPDQVPALMVSLAVDGGMAASALQFLILTACRTNEVVGAKWEEINFEEKLWNIPKERMKARRAHRVPLSKPALRLLKQVAQNRAGEFVFWFQNPGRPLSNMAMLTLLRRMKRNDVVPHGLRSTFRTWAAEFTSHPREVCEQALAHAISSATEAAYQRGDLLERRRHLMEDWGVFAMRRPIKAHAGRRTASHGSAAEI
jgi:integrase